MNAFLVFKNIPEERNVAKFGKKQGNNALYMVYQT